MTHVASLDQRTALPWLRWISLTVTTLIYLAALALVAVNILSLLGRFDWRADLVSHFRPHLAIGSLLFALCALFFLRYAAAGIGFVCCSVQLYLLLTAIPSPAVAATGQELKVMTINVLGENRRFQDLLRLVEQERPDILALQEMDWDWEQTARKVEKLFPHSTLPPHRHPPSNQIFSRFPIVDAKVQRLPPGAKQRGPTNAVLATLDIDGQPVDFINVHPSHPMSYRLWEGRNVFFDWIADRIAAAPSDRPVIVVGDWNLSPWSPWYTRFMERTGLKDAAALTYGEPTRHPRGYPGLYLLGVTIDHITVSPDIAVSSSDVGPDIGSDHRPVKAILHLPRIQG